MPATRKCRDDRVCMFQEKDGTCSVLRDTYKRSGDCPFCKEKLKDIGGREKRHAKEHGAEMLRYRDDEDEEFDVDDPWEVWD